jgi:hypothetical protein
MKGILTGLARVPIRLARMAHTLSSWRRTMYLRIRTRLERLFVRQLHTNACGDFTLCSRDVWFALRGYVEWPIFSWHLDSLLLHQARCNGHAEVDLPAPYRVFHIEHDIGSGYSPEGERSLFDRLERKGIPYLTWPDFLELDRQMTADAKRQGEIIFNLETWGFATKRFEETVVVARESREAVVS